MKINKKQIETKTESKQGITLIALVITIIVLLILAGVSIAMLTGENGILTQAQNAQKQTDVAQEDELRRLTALEAVTNLENTTYEDENGQTAPIPAGFAVSQVEGENTIEDGLVIIDSKGNEFVWIPVTDESKYIRNRTFEEVAISEEAYTDTEYLPLGIQPIANDSNSNETAERTAVMSAGGFYISRYEAGKEGESTLVSKKEATVWNNISQADCKTTAKTFINNENVKSALCSGKQWDITMDFVNGKQDGIGNIFDVTKYDSNRHTGSLEVSGRNEADKVSNIYDLEGNCREYIAEKSSSDTNIIFVRRGGYYNSTNRASHRSVDYSSAYTHLSFRFVLYVM